MGALNRIDEDKMRFIQTRHEEEGNASATTFETRRAPELPLLTDRADWSAEEGIVFPALTS